MSFDFCSDRYHLAMLPKSRSGYTRLFSGRLETAHGTSAPAMAADLQQKRLPNGTGSLFQACVMIRI
ncbi:hypothetical protein [Dyadobacter beijingensis]|uniref:hypothetical protein n=1 Tax=Dyadobacter beijingensis TaxID=365489 RepID=UPI00039B96A3|nr:hypothetical protein [Dyadobacter beijingensis]